MNKILIPEFLDFIVGHPVAGFCTCIRQEIPDTFLGVPVDRLQGSCRIDHGEKPVAPGKVIVSGILQQFAVEQADKSSGGTFATLSVPLLPACQRVRFSAHFCLELANSDRGDIDGFSIYDESEKDPGIAGLEERLFFRKEARLQQS